MKQKIICLILSLMLLVSLIGCAQSRPQEPAAPTESSTPPANSVSTPADELEPQASVNLTILYEQDDSMINTYSLLAVDESAPFTDADGKPVHDVTINTVGAKALIDWILSEDGPSLIQDYGYADYGEYLFYLMEDRPVSTADIPSAEDDTRTIRLSTTTSVNDSGLLEYLLPVFEKEYGYTVEVASAGTGKAIAAAQYGNADLILVHSKSQEEAFIQAGFAKQLEGYEQQRLSFMYNYFVLVGPSEDPAGCSAAASVKDAFQLICDGNYTFVSRGDKSGTHTKELSLWPEELGITDEADSVVEYTDWYIYSNAGMGVCLTMAEEMDGYILSDKATFLTFRASNGQME